LYSIQHSHPATDATRSVTMSMSSSSWNTRYCGNDGLANELYDSNPGHDFSFCSMWEFL